MKKTLNLTILLLLSLFVKQSSAQDNYLFSLGLTGHAINSPAYLGNAYSATISSRYTVVEITEDLNISLGTHASVGMTLPSTGAEFFLEAPVVAELNFGHGAYNEPSYDFGGFIGGGYGQNVITYQYNQQSSQLFTSGLYLNGGVKFYMGGRSLGLRLSYMKDAKESTDIFGLGLMYNFGDFMD